MGNGTKIRLDLVRVAAAALLLGSVTACESLTTTPAPVDQRVGMPPAPSHRAGPPMRQITVEAGQSVSRIAQRYHVAERAIIAANHLQPPYKLKIGMHLLIPDNSAPRGPGPMQAATAPAAPIGEVTPLAPAAAPAAAAAPSPQSAMPEVVPLDGPPPAASAPPAAEPAAHAAAASSPPPATAAPTQSAGSGPPPVVAPRNAAAALPLPGDATLGGPTATAGPPQAAPPPQAAAAAAPAAMPPAAAKVAGGRFPWPVRGRVLSAFGGTAEGARNDGINIGAARGTPVHAIDAGTVAYVGNEVHGYGNLVLVKHANGWISAYAHLESIEVRLGDEVQGGQEIAKVGNSGGVIEPQLHFELRRGKTPVDPRQYLAPAPSAGTGSGGAGKG